MLNATLRNRLAFASLLSLFAFLPQTASAAPCTVAGPVAANAKTTVVYDPVTANMKACIGGNWLDMSGGGGGGNLDGLTDVTISSPSTNQALVYNGSAWVNASLSLTESDPKVGALTGNQWCAANAGGTAIVCNQAAPSGGGSSNGTAGFVQISGGSGAFASSSTTAGQQLFWDGTNHRLGIGVNAPTTQLTIGTTGTITVQNGGSAATPAYAVTTGGLGVNGMFVPAANSLAFVTSATERVRIDGNGDLGIGVTSPDWKLHISDAIAPVIQLAEVDSGGNAFIGVDGNNLFFRRGTIGTTDAMTITSTGNVGIGTVGPSAKLHVSGGDARITPGAGNYAATFTGNVASALSITGGIANNEYARITFGNGAAGNYAGIGAQITAGGSYLLLGTSNNYANGITNEALVIGPTGNVGIGGSGVASKLYVNGTAFVGSGIWVADGGLPLINNAPWYGMGVSNLTLGGQTSVVQVAGYYGLNFQTASGQMVMLNNGNVGIGLTNPGHKLQVAGGASGAAILATGNDSAQYAGIFYAQNGLGGAYFAHNQYIVNGTSSNAGTTGIYGYVSGASSIGVQGYATQASSHAFLAQNTSSSYYCYIGYANTYALICSGPNNIVSDQRLKKDIVSLDRKEGLDAIMALRPVSYLWKDDRKNQSGKRQLGFVAQEVEKVLPDVVNTFEPTTDAEKASVKEGEGKLRSVQYEGLVAPLVQAVQELKAENDALRARIEKLEENK